MKLNDDKIIELMNATKHHAYFVAKQFFRDDAMAEDMLQESYIKAFKSIDKLDDMNNFGKWLNRIVINTCKDELRKRKEFSFSDIETDDISIEIPDRMTYSPEEIANYNDTKDIIMSILEELPIEQRVTLFLFYYEEYSIKEISEQLSVSESTVKSRLRYGRKAVENSVIEYQKKHDIKLYSTAVIPLIIYAWENSEKTFQVSEVILNEQSVVKVKKSLKGFLTKKGVISIVVAGVIVLGIVVVNDRRKDEKLVLRDEEVIVEYGEQLPLDPRLYLKNENEEFLEKVVIQTDVKGEFPETGEHEIYINYKDQNEIFVAEVKDTVAPKFSKFKDELEFYQGDDIRLDKYFTAEDLSEVSVEIKRNEFDINVVGTYTIEVIACDIHKNKISREAKVIVKEKEITNAVDEKVYSPENKPNQEKQKEYVYDRSNPIVAAALDQVGGKGICSMVADNAISAIGKTAWIMETTTTENGGTMTSGGLSPENFLKIGTIIPMSSIQPGDIIYYSDGGMGVSHVAIYIGNEMCVHGGWTNQDIVIYSMYIGSGLQAVRIN